MKNNGLFAQMDALYKSLEGLTVDASLLKIDELAKTVKDSDFLLQIRITKAEQLRRKGEVKAALDLLIECSNEAPNVESVSYFVSELLAEQSMIKDAFFYLDRAIKAMKENDSNYYQDSVYLLRAYCSAKLGKLEDAERDLTRVKHADANLFWLEIKPAISIGSVREMLGPT
jgi:predicted Zn-dependent protease